MAVASFVAALSLNWLASRAETKACFKVSQGQFTTVNNIDFWYVVAIVMQCRHGVDHRAEIFLLVAQPGYGEADKVHRVRHFLTGYRIDVAERKVAQLARAMSVQGQKQGCE
jgi:hypothetical protein